MVYAAVGDDVGSALIVGSAVLGRALGVAVGRNEGGVVSFTGTAGRQIFKSDTNAFDAGTSELAADP